MQDVRCKGCGKLLAKVNVINGAIKCHGCGKLFEYKVFTNLQMYSSNDIMPSEPQEGRYNRNR